MPCEEIPGSLPPALFFERMIPYQNFFLRMDTLVTCESWIVCVLLVLSSRSPVTRPVLQKLKFFHKGYRQLLTLNKTTTT